MQKNVASQVIGAQMVSATDGSAFTGSVTVYVTGDAGTQAVGSVGSGACTHEGNGYHTYAPAQAETNYDLIAFTFVGTGAVPVTVQVFTRHDSNLTHIAGSAVNTSTAQLGVNVVNFGGSAGTFASGRPEVNTTHWGGTAVASAVVGADIQTIKTQTVTCAAGVTVGAYVGGTGAAALETTAQSILTDTAEIGAAGAGLTAITGLIGTPTDFGSGTSTLAANLQDLADNGTATYDRSTDSLQAIRDRGDAAWITATGFSTHSAADVWTSGTRTLTANTNLNDPTAAAIADAVWDEAIAGHLAAGSTGEALNGATAPTAAAVADAVWDEATADHVGAGSFGKAAGDTLADTNELQGDWANGGRLDLLIDAILADTGTDGVVLSTATQQAIADALLDRAAGVETSWTVRQALRIILSAAGGKLSGAATTTIAIRDVADSKDRITATVDADGNRTAVTLDAT